MEGLGKRQATVRRPGRNWKPAERGTFSVLRKTVPDKRGADEVRHRFYQPVSCRNRSAASPADSLPGPVQLAGLEIAVLRVALPAADDLFGRPPAALPGGECARKAGRMVRLCMEHKTWKKARFRTLESTSGSGPVGLWVRDRPPAAPRILGAAAPGSLR